MNRATPNLAMNHKHFQEERMSYVKHDNSKKVKQHILEKIKHMTDIHNIWKVLEMHNNYISPWAYP
jgi:hypothetical protein